MKKEEFPTFLNEQPTIIFGRTGRELLIIAMGLSIGYMLWGHLGAIVAGAALGTMIIKAFISLVPIIISAVVALTNIGGRPLEEWAFVWTFYILTPRVYIYLPFEEKELSDDEIKDLQRHRANNQDDEDNEDY